MNSRARPDSAAQFDGIIACDENTKWTEGYWAREAKFDRARQASDMSLGSLMVTATRRRSTADLILRFYGRILRFHPASFDRVGAASWRQ